jgi:hypothetical protein
METKEEILQRLNATRFYPIRRLAPIDFYDPRSAKIAKLNNDAQLALYQSLLWRRLEEQSK